MRETITLECTKCKNRNYTTTRNKKTKTQKLEANKFCKFCRTQTLHKEIK